MTTNRTNLRKIPHNRRTVQACLMLVPFPNRRKWEIWKLGGGKNWRLWNWNFQFYDLLEELYIEIGRPKKGIPVGVRALEAWWLRFIWFDALLKSHESNKELKRLTFPPMFSFILDGRKANKHDLSAYTAVRSSSFSSIGCFLLFFRYKALGVFTGPR